MSADKPHQSDERTVAVLYRISAKEFGAILHAMHGPPPYDDHPPLTSGPHTHSVDANLVIRLDQPAPHHGMVSDDEILELLSRSADAAAVSLVWEQSFRRALWDKTKSGGTP